MDVALSPPDQRSPTGEGPQQQFYPSPTSAVFFSPTSPSQSWSSLCSPAPAAGRSEPGSRSGSGDAAVPTAPSPSSPANPFNFQTQIISPLPGKPSVGQRRGHRYRHSSISAQHQIFQEPLPRPPPILPASLPIPTIREAWRSMHRDQRARLYWSLCHVAVAMVVFFRAEGSLALTALSHLSFFDAGSAAVCVAVDVLGNFEVWRRSSIRHPFGLERVEVLAGFAMSVFLLFGGFDLLSHGLKHVLSGAGDVVGRHGHTHGHDLDHDRLRAHAAGLDWAVLAAIVTTLVSAYGLKNHTRIAKAMRVSYLASLPSILSNPFHFLTLSFSSLLLLLPHLSLSIPHVLWLDRLFCAAIALSMFALGLQLAVAQALMLLMSYGGGRSAAGVAAVIREIESEPGVVKLEDAKFWQAHYGLGVATLRVRVTKDSFEAAPAGLRSRIASLVQKRLCEGYGRGGNLRWEVTLEVIEDAMPGMAAMSPY